MARPAWRRGAGHRTRALIGSRPSSRLWTADFKGQFRTRDGIYCYPLTIADQHSRNLLTCHGLPSTHGGLRTRRIPSLDR
jgi:hypothetical protein